MAALAIGASVFNRRELESALIALISETKHLDCEPGAHLMNPDRALAKREAPAARREEEEYSTSTDDGRPSRRGSSRPSDGERLMGRALMAGGRGELDGMRSSVESVSGRDIKAPPGEPRCVPLCRRGTDSKVALLYAVAAETMALRRSLEACADVMVAHVADRVAGTDWDVIVVDASSTSLTLVEFALREWENLGTPEVVVAPSQPCASIVAALANFGLRYVMTLESACVWMPQTVHALAALARARRAEKRALDALAKVPLPVPCTSTGISPLFSAETAFREAYLRLIVACNPTLREAAVAAGVPYRSFQRMLTTHGIRRIDPPETDNQRPYRQGSDTCKAVALATARQRIGLGG